MNIKPAICLGQHVPIIVFVERKSDAALIRDGIMCARCGVELRRDWLEKERPLKTLPRPGGGNNL